MRSDCYSIYQEIASFTLESITIRLSEHFGGESVFFPQRMISPEGMVKDAQILQEKGLNHQQIAHELGISVRTVGRYLG